MRIACVNQDPGIAPGRKKGAAVHVAALQRAFRGLGCDVVAIEDKSGDAVERALELLHGERPLDLVYERFAIGATGAARFCARTAVPLFVEVNSPLIDEARDHRGFEPTERDLEAEALVLSTASRLFPVSTHVALYLARRGAASERIAVTPNGVDVDLFRPRPRRAGALAIPDGAFAIGFHGRLRPWHNFGLLARAFERLLARGLPVHLAAIGEGDFEAHLGRIPRERVTLRRWMEPERLAEHVARFDASPLTYADGAACYFSPLKLLEAMACGAVPLVPNLGDLPEAVGHGRCGLIYAAGDEHALADALASLIERPERRVELGRAAIERARQRTWIDVAGEILRHAPAARGSRRVSAR